MIPIDFSGKVALVTGVGDNESFAWYIAKALQAAGAKIVLACHPRMVGIVESILTREQDREVAQAALRRRRTQGREDPALRRQLRHDGRRPGGHAQPTAATPSIPGLLDPGHRGRRRQGVRRHRHPHPLVAFSREIKKQAMDTSRAAYLRRWASAPTR